MSPPPERRQAGCRTFLRLRTSLAADELLALTLKKDLPSKLKRERARLNYHEAVPEVIQMRYVPVAIALQWLVNGGRMHCLECNNALSDHSKFCSECGTKVRESGSADTRLDGADPKPTKAATVKQYAIDVAEEAGELSKTALKSELGKKIAAGAAIGAVVAVPVPFVGPAVGAVVGAGIVAFRRLTK